MTISKITLNDSERSSVNLQIGILVTLATFS